MKDKTGGEGGGGIPGELLATLEVGRLDRVTEERLDHKGLVVRLLLVVVDCSFFSLKAAAERRQRLPAQPAQLGRVLFELVLAVEV